VNKMKHLLILSGILLIASSLFSQTKKDSIYVVTESQIASGNIDSLKFYFVQAGTWKKKNFSDLVASLRSKSISTTLQAAKPSPLSTFITDVVIDTVGIDSAWVWNASIYGLLQTGGGVADGSVTTAKLANNAVDSTKAANLSPNDLAQTGATTNDVLTWTGSKYAPRVPSVSTTQIANTNGTTIATTAYVDRRGAAGSNLFLYGKTVTFFGDSYTAGFGPTTALERWTTQFCQFFGAIENNLGVSGTTLEKRSPQDWSGSTPNMVDNVASIPTKTASGGLLVFAYGLNDVGYNGGQYNTTNYITDYTTVINAAIAKGWDVKQILLIAPYYINSTGYANYTTQNGTVPDATRHLAFVDATATVASTFGTLYLDIYRKQLLNDITLLIADGIHANTAGHLYIANEVGSYLFGESFREFRHNDASGFGNSAMVFNFNDYATIAVNRNRVGTFFNTSKAASQISLYGGALDGRIDFFTSPSNNTTPVNSVTITKDGILNTKISTRSNTLFGTGGSLTSLSSDQAIYGGGVQYDGSNWKALGTSSALMTLGLNQGAVAGISFYVNSSNTIGANITPTEVIRIGVGGSTYIGGSVNATARLHLAAGTATASTAPLKLTAGTLLTTPETGAIEFASSRLTFTPASTRHDVLIIPSTEQPSVAAGTKANVLYTGNGSANAATYSYFQSGVFSGTTDSNGDIQLLFPSALPDTTYSILVTVAGTTLYSCTAHTKATGGVYIRCFNSSGTVLGAGINIDLNYEARDY